jgi:uncharacterized protein (DUF433 family)
MKQIATICYVLKITPRQLCEDYNNLVLEEIINLIEEERWQAQMTSR